MTSSTTNLGLTVYNLTTDQSGSFQTWTQNMSGSSVSNMTKIDEYAGGLSGSVTNLSSSMSGSVTTINAQLSGISGSITTLLADVVTLNTRLKKLDEFSGGGLADFNNISGSYTHLLLIGSISGSLAGAGNSIGDIGMDFNGDANNSHYAYGLWRNFAGAGALEVFNTNSYGSIGVGVALSASVYPNYGLPFFAIIPNYSVSTSLYKSAFGIGGGYFGFRQISIIGGYWRSTNAITRIRMFCTVGSSYRYNFFPGSKITLYGLG